VVISKICEAQIRKFTIKNMANIAQEATHASTNTHIFVSRIAN